MYAKGVLCAPMSNELLTAEIKTRVQPQVKEAFEAIARDRHLDVSDIVREAFREFLAKHPKPQPEEVAA
jgi:hypothetical protein